MSMSLCVEQKKGWDANMKKNRKVYIVMGHAFDTKSTYISEVCTSKKKADAHQKYMSELMARADTGFGLRVYWVHDARVV